MPAAALKPLPTQSTSKRAVLMDLPYEPVAKRPLPPGRAREWYVTHNRRLKAMRLAIALLDSGVYVPNQARDERYAAPRNSSVSIRRRTPRATWCGR